MSKFTVVEVQPDLLRVSCDGFAVDICCIGHDRHGNTLWNYVSYHRDMGRVTRDAAIERASEVLQSILLDHPVCGRCHDRHPTAMSCEEWEFESAIPF
jgi:hypothetical protein